ncbi:MAG: AraC family transcriptional regulator [Candidatus Electryonea clarkiae]|nr:AraC family transcriptional regulator [Candidatus Electryonea clarkiae]MDP8287411.1 AraC family transcriptional regulator [Candidatus Electryonea clarkiae]
MKKFQNEEYIARINRVIDYINSHITEELTLDILAEVACFSRYHFHRIFHAMIGETLNQFIQRIRVEKAAAQLVNNPKISITEIALDCGFSGSAAFARAFKDAFQMSASEWRAGGYRLDRKNRKKESNNSQTIDKIRKEIEISSSYVDNVTHNQIWRMKVKNKKVETKKDFQVEVKELPEMHLAYVRHIGPYKGDAALFENLFNKLMTWAGPRNLLRFPETKMMAMYHDNPEITDESKLRTDACITIPPDTKVDGEIGKSKIDAGKYAVARFELSNDEYEEAWNAFFGGWFPQSGYQPDDGACFELYQNDPKEHPENKCIVDICVPVKPL